MEAKDFAGHWKKERDYLFDLYTSGKEETVVAELIKGMTLTDEQTDTMKSVVGQVLTDTFYTLLLGLDGSASIGDLQHKYKIYDEDNNLISECGELEAEAYEEFHGG